MSASGHETTHFVRLYVNVFVALMALTVVTVGASYLHLTVPLAIGVAIVIAIVKGSLVAGFFMHLIREKPAIVAMLVLVAVLFGALMILPVLTMKNSVGTPYTPFNSAASPASVVER